MKKTRKKTQEPPQGQPNQARNTPNPLFVLRCQGLVDEAVSKGAKVTTGGKRNPDHPNGLFYLPTVSADRPRAIRSYEYYYAGSRQGTPTSKLAC